MGIGPPPEFARDGSPPPIVSEPVEIGRWHPYLSLYNMIEDGLAMVRLSERLSGGDDSRSVGRGLLALIPMIPAELQERRAIKELLRARGALHLNPREVGGWQLDTIYTQFWRREDPTTQLPPGGTTERTVSLRVGLSQEHVREVAASLGLSSKPGGPLGLSGQLSEKSTVKVALSAEKEVTRKLVLTNPSTDAYHRIALWHLVHRLTLIASPREESPEKQLICQVTEFVPSDAINATSRDLPRPRH